MASAMARNSSLRLVGQVRVSVNRGLKQDFYVMLHIKAFFRLCKPP